MSTSPVVFIAGPTASGKTSLAMALADRRDVALINVDAAQVYRGLNIGSAKPDAQALQNYPHALIDICEPSEVYDVSRFVDDARRLIQHAQAQNKCPVLVGGSLFYFSALENGVSKLPAANAKVRKVLLARASEIGWAGMYQKLQIIDPKICQTIQANDKQRIQRALEIHELTQDVPSDVMANDVPQAYDKPILKFNLFTPDRALLHTRIAERFTNMLNDGLVAEVELLLARQDLNRDLPAMRCVGYRQVAQYLADDITYDEMQAQAIAATRQLAKRQLTWLRHQRGQIWLSSEYTHNVDHIEAFLPK